MTREQAIESAMDEAIKNQVSMVVVHDPIGNAEDESGPFGYCPTMGVKMLFPNGIVVAEFVPRGKNVVRWD